MKYRDNQYKIYDPGMITNILDSELKKHNIIEKDDMTSSIKLIVWSMSTLKNSLFLLTLYSSKIVCTILSTLNGFIDG